MRRSGQTVQLLSRKIHGITVRALFFRATICSRKSCVNVFYWWLNCAPTHEHSLPRIFRGVLWVDQRAIEMDYLHPCASLMLRLPTHAQKNENASQNDTVRHRKIPYGTVRNRSEKNAKKLQEKNVRNRTRQFCAFSFTFSHFFPRACRWKCRKARLKFGFEMSMLAKMVCSNYLAFFWWPKHSASPWNDFCIPLKVLILPPIYPL